MPGRPAKLTPFVIQELAQNIALGLDRDTACKAVGIRPRTYRDWYAMGKRRGGLHRQFRQEMDLAKAKLLQFWVGAARVHALGRAAQGGTPAIPASAEMVKFMLRKLDPKRFGDDPVTKLLKGGDGDGDGDNEKRWGTIILTSQVPRPPERTSLPDPKIIEVGDESEG